MKYFSMFSGIGGFELGIKQAYDNRQTSNNQRGSAKVLSEDMPDTERNDVERSLSCIGYSEIDKYACQIYDKHFKHKNYGDCTKINASDLPDFDLLVGGFPCQAFSVAGKRKGFDDTRGTLFFDIARILSEKRPRLVVLENVKGLLSHDKGKTFQTILGVLTDLGYDVEWQVLNSKDWGVPQNRERIFIIGHLGRGGGQKVFPIGEDAESIVGECNKRVQESEIAQTLTATYHKGGKGSQIVRAVLTPDRANKRQNGRRMKEDGEPSFTLTGQDKHGVYDGARIRRLTPTECERLQGFPDGWTEGLSDTQRYKTLGNAVTVNVIKTIFEIL